MTNSESKNNVTNLTDWESPSMVQPFAIGSYRDSHGIEQHIDSESTGDVVFRLLLLVTP
jgi:hypothetical protein